ncbi:MAG: ribosomal protein S18-alanine N-acetyltransferase [Corynebacterium sp.]|nr:ribosomal protein S18-alanine N-acetyltransferase [Corynebacterium sp.]
MELRELTVADAPRLAELEKHLFSAETPWSQSVFESEIPQPHNAYFGIINDNGVVVGYAGVGMRGPQADPEFEVLTIGTDPQHQRQGVGKMLMDYVTFIADEYQAPVFLEVRVGNEPATSLYEKYGFEYLGIRRGYYQPSGADAHVMRRSAVVVEEKVSE